MTLINLEALQTMLTAPGPLARGTIQAQYWAGDRPFVSIAGAKVTFPELLTIKVEAGEAARPLRLAPTAGISCVKWMIRSASGLSLERYTAVPDVDTISFGDLVDVDPDTFEQAQSAVSAWEAWRLAAEVLTSRSENAAGRAEVFAAQTVVLQDAAMATVQADEGSQFSVDQRAKIDARVGDSPLGVQVAKIAAELASRQNARAALRTFHRDLLDTDTKRVNVLVIDDSTGEGSNASHITKRSISRLQTLLRQWWSRQSGGGFGYVPGRYMTGIPGAPVSGSIAGQDRANWGLGRRGIVIGTSQKWTLTCDPAAGCAATSVVIVYPKINFNGGPVEVYVNNTLHGEFTNYEGGQTVVSDDRTYTVAGLNPAQVNTIEIRGKGTSGGYIGGAVVYNGDETKGITVLDACHAGSTSAFFAATPNTSYWRDEVALLNPSLLILGPYLNDEAAQIPVATFRANLESIIASVNLKSGKAPVSVLLTPKWDRGRATGILPAQYTEAMRSLAADNGYGFLDFGAIFKANGQAGLLADGTHPNDAGYELLAQSLASYLLPA